MIKACLWAVDKCYLKNKIFDINDTVLNRDNCLFSLYKLKEEMALNGIDLSTQDINSSSDSEIIFFLEVPDKLPEIKSNAKRFLIIFETEVVRPKNWIKRNHIGYDAIFTWRDDVVDNISYFKINFSHLFPNVGGFDINEKTKFCALVAGNKSSTHRLELYSERLKTIKWFERHQPESLDLYGIGWDRHYFRGNKFVRLLNRIKPLTKAFKPNRTSYRGKIVDKATTLRSYKFSICYENARDIPGYITEKIFDCFFALCVPIYWGADNISAHIPESCYIDRKSFASHEEMFEFLQNMPDEDYGNYIKAILQFMISNQSQQFEADFFAKKITNVVLEKYA